MPYPGGFGADFVGTVHALGPDTTGFAVGDRVVATEMPHCGTCPICRSGRTNLCQQIADPMRHRGECFQEIALVDARRAAIVPVTVSDEDAASLAAINMSINVFELADPPPGSEVAVVGVGAMGTGVIQVGAALGHRVTAIHRNDSRLQIARSLGAAAAVPSSAMEDWDVVGPRPALVVETAGTQATVEAAIDLVALGGTVVLVGTGPWPVPSRPIGHKELRIVGVRGGHHQQAAIAMAAAGRVGLGSTIGVTYPLASAPEAFREAETANVIRVGVRPEVEG
jgi:L-iditol 2-dehydrogenase